MSPDSSHGWFDELNSRTRRVACHAKHPGGDGHGSDGANRAVDAAAGLTKALGAKLSILTVGGGLQEDETKQLARAEADVGAALDAISNRILSEAEARARRIGEAAVEGEAAWGDPAEMIIRNARDHGADAIVLGRRGRGRLIGLLLGSVSQ